MRRLLVVCGCGLATVAWAQGPVQPAADAWYDLPVPGRVDALLTVAGLDPTLPRTRALREVIRVVHAIPSGRDPAVADQQQRVATYLRSIGSSEQITGLPSDTVPLPLAPSTWTSLLQPRKELAGSLFTALLGDRRASLLYVGLLACDAPTRLFFDTHPDLLREILNSDRVAVFAGASTGIRIHDRRVVTPGGADAQRLWEALVDESADRPERFILKLLARDQGRLALLYDAVAQFEPARQAFVLGPAGGDPVARRDHLERVYAATKALSEVLPLAVRPFGRNVYDALHILALVPVDHQGRLRGPAWRLLWRKAFESDAIPTDPAGDLADLDAEGRLDAAGLLALVVQGTSSIAQKRDRVESLVFVLRVFEHAPREALPDVLVTARTFGWLRALVCTLDRLGISDAPVFAAAVRQADRLMHIDGRQRVETALGLFQGSLALVEHARLARTLDAAAASRLVRSFTLLPMSESGEYLGVTGAWITDSLLPELAAALESSPDSPARATAAPTNVEQTILAAFAGRPLSPSDSLNLSIRFEGQQYRVDPALARQAHLRVIRARQRAVSPEAALAFARAASALAEPGSAAGRIPLPTAAVEEAAQEVARALEASRSTWLDVKAFRTLVAEALADLRQVSPSRDAHKVARAALPLQRASDAVLANATMSLAYTAFLIDPAGHELLDGDPAGRHDWGLGGTSYDSRSPLPWTLADDSRTAVGWCLRGALLGADVARATLALRRVAGDRVPQAPTVSENNIRALSESIVLTVPLDQSDADREALVGALARGRQRLGAVLTAADWMAVAEAMGLTDYRRTLLPWTLAREPDQVEHFVTLGDLVRLGHQDGAEASVPDAWGTSGLAFDGRWNLRYPSSPISELLAGRPGSAATAAGVPDLVLALAEAMHDRKFPAALTRDVLACATQDLIDDAQLQYEDDWLSLSVQARRIPERLDEYVAVLTASGPLVPAPRQ